MGKIKRRTKILISTMLFVLSVFISLFGTIIEVQGATGNSTGMYSKWYGGYETFTPYITIDGIVAWCINPELDFPINQAYIESVSNDIGVYNILYYAELNGYHLNEDDYVDTFVALNWYLGKPTSQAKQNDPTVKFLYNKAKNPDAPVGAFDIQNKIQTASFTSGNTYQETGWYKPVTDGSGIKYTITVPSGITLITSDGQTKSAGTHTLNQNQNFKLRAPVDYAGTVTLKADTNILKKRALIFLPTTSGVQRLASLGYSQDPATVPNITASFYKRTGKGAIYKKDKATNKGLPGATFSVKNLNTGKTGTVTTDSNGYVGWGEALIGHKLEVTETKSPNNYILDSTKQTITVQSGNTNNLTFQNDKKAELQLSKVQIYTDEAEDGLPINIYTKRIQTSPTANQQQVTVAVYEKESGQKVLSIPYKIGEIPGTINAKIPSTHLNGNQKRNYIVKLEVDSRYAYVTTGYGQIDTDGYTASKQKITVQAKDTEKIDYKGVIMTERSINQTMKVYYETFSLPTNKISKQKTGYGFERDFKPTYTNDLNQATAFNMKVTVDSALIDSYLPYAKTNGKSEVKLEKSSKGIYQLPHVNVERKTGALFTDQQVASNDSRIEYELQDGGRKLYVPIWIDLGDYALSSQNIEPIGVNQISFVVHDSLNLYAYMFGHYNSETIELDEIVFEPLLHSQPFPNGIPDNWGYTKPDGTKALTDEEKAWFDQNPTQQMVTITFDKNGGTGNIANLSVAVGEGVAIPNQIPTKTNYVFDGWGYNGRVYKVGDIIKPTANITVKAEWRNQEQAITYDANGGTGAPANENVAVGSVYTVSSKVPTKEGSDFEGWNYNGSVYQPGSAMTMPSENVSFVAKWTDSKQAINYDANGGTGAPANTSAKMNSTYTVPNTVPTRTNYTFKGWEYNGSVYQPGSTVAVTNKDVNLKAIWEVKMVLISFDGSGGFNVPNDDQAEVGKAYILPTTTPSKELVQFEGWKNPIDGKTYQPGSSVTLTDKDIKFVAVWKNNEQTITFDNNGGSSSLTTAKVETGSMYKIPATIPTKSGNGFRGWEYEGKTYQPGETITVPEKDITLLAQWEVGRYQVTHDVNGGTGVPEDVTVGANMEYGIPSIVPTRTGHTHNGWKNSVDSKIYQPGSVMTVIRDTILTAEWIPNTYTITYNANGGTGAPGTQSFKYDSGEKISTVIPTRTGYIFSHWTHKGNILSPGQTIPTGWGSFDLTAQWTPNTFTITYNANGGTGAPGDQTFKLDSGEKISTVIPTRAGHTFSHWTHQGNILSPGQTIPAGWKSFDLTAQWSPWQHAINYNLNGGSGTSTGQTKTYGVALSLHGAPTRSWYNFAGWQSSRNGVVYGAGANYLPDYDGGSTTMTAQWSPWQHTVSYNLNGGSGTSTGQTKTYGVALSLHGAPTRSGYRFAGWQSSRDGTIHGGGSNYPPDYNGGTTIMTAQWVEQVDYIFVLHSYGQGGTSNAYGFGTEYDLHLVGGKPYYMETSGRIDQQAKNDGKSLTVFLYPPDWTWATSTATSSTVQSWPGSYFVAPKSGQYNITGYLYPNGGSRSGLAYWSHSTIYQDDTYQQGKIWKTVDKGKVLTLPSPNASRTGYTFTGWKNSVDGRIYQPGSTVTLTSAKTNFSAQWTINKHTVTFDGVGNASKVESRFMTLYNVPGQQTINYGSQATIPTTKPRRIEHTFEFIFTGWRNSADGKLYQPGAKITITKNTKLTAEWQDGPRVHTVVFDDTLYSLATKYLGSPSKVGELKAMNNLTSDKIYVGQKLRY